MARLVAMLVGAAVALTPTPAPPGLPNHLKGLGGDRAIALKAAKTSPATRRARVATAAPRRAAPRVLRLTVPACEGNDPRTGGADDALCPAALVPCRRLPGGDSYLVWTYTSSTVVNPGRDDWALASQRCVSPRQAREPAATSIPALTLEEFRRLPLPPEAMHLQPGNGQVLVQMPTNAYVDAKPVQLRTTVLGTGIDVIATPQSFTWDFGDGRPFVTTDPGAPYPALRVTHTYRRPGKYSVRLTVSYSGVFRPAGTSDWIPVEGTAEVPGPAVMLEAIEARAVLVP